MIAGLGQAGARGRAYPGFRSSSIWWATKNEWLGLIDVAGLELGSLAGGFNGEPVGGVGTGFVFVARRGPSGA